MKVIALNSIYLSPVRNKPKYHFQTNTPLFVNNGINRDAFCGKIPEPIYAIDMAGNYTRYESTKKASEALNISASSIGRCLNGYTKSSKGYAFIEAQDAEKVTKGGKIVVNEDIIKELSENIKNKPLSNKGSSSQNTSSKRYSFYSISKDGSYQGFTNTEDATNALGVSKISIKYCLSGQTAYTKSGYIFVEAYEIERTDKDGNIFVDENAVKKLASKIQNPFYVIDKDGNYTKYLSIKDAAKKLNLTQEQKGYIYNILRGKNTSSQGYTFVRAEKIEDSKTGKPIKSLIMFYASKIKSGKMRSFYAIDEQGNYKKYEMQKDAADDVDVVANTISEALKKGSHPIKGHVYIYADEIEIKDDKGNVSLDETKLMAARKELQKKAIYVVDSTGEHKRLNNLKQAFLNGFALLSSEKNFQNKNGYYIIYASQIEDTDENGNFVLNENKLMQKFEQLRQRAIYLIDKNGQTKRFNNPYMASMMTYGIDYVPRKKQYALKEGYKMVQAVLVESKDENGLYYLDENKLRDVLANIENE